MTYPAKTSFDSVIPSNLEVEGNLTVDGTSTVTGAQTFSGAVTIAGALAANGGITCDTNKFTVADVSGNTVVGGTLGVTGATTLTGALAANGGITVDTTAFTVADTTGATHIAGDLDVATNKFTVASASGNTVVAGTLGVTSDLAVATNKFTVAAASGNTAVAGTLNITGATLLAGGITAGGSPRGAGTWTINSATDGTNTACTNGTMYVGMVFLQRNCTVTGIQYLVGSVGGTDSVIVSLHNAAGVVLANSAVGGTVVGTAAQSQQVPFTAQYTAVGPALMWIGLTFNGATAKFRTVPAYCNVGHGLVGGSVAQTFGTVAAFTPPTTFTADVVPVASLY